MGRGIAGSILMVCWLTFLVSGCVLFSTVVFLLLDPGPDEYGNSVRPEFAWWSGAICVVAGVVGAAALRWEHAEEQVKTLTRQLEEEQVRHTNETNRRMWLEGAYYARMTPQLPVVAISDLIPPNTDIRTESMTAVVEGEGAYGRNGNCCSGLG